MAQLKEKHNQYEDILGVQTVIERDEIVWEEIQKERERFFKFMGFTQWL